MRILKTLALILTLLCAVAAAGVQKPVDVGDRKLDEFGNLSCGDEMARLDHFALVLNNDPDHIGYIFVYGGRESRLGEAQARLTRIRKYLVKNRGLSASRLKFLDGGYREDLTVELYAFPSKDDPPLVNPTVDPAEVKVKPGKIKKSELSCKGVG